MQHWLEQLLRHRYGQKRERVDENQLFLFAAEIASTGRRAAARAEAGQRANRGPLRQGTGGSGCRSRWNGGAWSTTWPTTSGSAPSARCELRHIGEEISERLEYVPASLHVIEQACQKYACPKGCTVVTAAEAAGADREGAGRDRDCWRTWR